ncbi:MAG: helix-turn-helix domain-containing protein [Mycobacterium sp.]|uniref:helix-turn-helix domain-containing protein n=1 Tax=Mycobacterium sp. TaxID=1785 RepID=UPI003F9B499F
MTSADDDRGEYIRQLRAAGWSVPEIGEDLGLSRSQVYRILAVVGDPAREPDDNDEDDWDIDGAEAEFDATGDEDPHVLPFTHVGEDPPGSPRYLDGNGASMSSLDFYRWCTYRRNDDGDWQLAADVEADMARQITEYAARERV